MRFCVSTVLIYRSKATSISHVRVTGLIKSLSNTLIELDLIDNFKTKLINIKF